MRTVQVLLLAALTMTLINDARAQTAPPSATAMPKFVDPRRLPGSDTGSATDTAQPSAIPAESASPSAEAEAKRKADDEKRLAAEAEAKRKADDEKRLAAEAEAKRKADDEKRLTAEAEAKRKADDEKRLAAEAEAKRKADDEKRLAAEAEAKRKADDEKRLAAEAEAKRKAEAESVRAAEEALKRKAADVETLVEDSKKNRAAESGNKNGLPPPAQHAPTASGPKDCPAPVIQSKPLAGGLASVEIFAPCQSGKSVVIRYEGLASNFTLGTGGTLSTVLDLIFGSEPGALVEIEGFAPAKLSLAGLEMDKVTKTAVLWTSDVNVDLHAFEYAAITGGPGHIWQGNPSTSADAAARTKADGLGHGYLSHADDGQHEGPKMEVYTFLHSPGQMRGLVTFGLDFATRGATPAGDNCGRGDKAELAFETITRSPNGTIRKESGIIPSAKCGVPLSAAARRNAAAIPELRLNR